MHDTFGNPLGAPLEALRKEFLVDSKTKDVEVVRADVVKIGFKNIPKAFKVMGIPTVYFVSKKGQAVQYSGNPHATDALTNFVVKAHKFCIAVETKKDETELTTETTATKKDSTEAKKDATETKKDATGTKKETTATKKDDTETK